MTNYTHRPTARERGPITVEQSCPLGCWVVRGDWWPTHHGSQAEAEAKADRLCAARAAIEAFEVTA